MPSFQNNTTHMLVLLPVGQNQNEKHKGKLCAHYAQNPEAYRTLNRFQATCLWPCRVLMWSNSKCLSYRKRPLQREVPGPGALVGCERWDVVRGESQPVTVNADVTLS